jgi:hypothetical protein
MQNDNGEKIVKSEEQSLATDSKYGISNAKES